MLHHAWQDKITSLKDESLVRYLVLSGFDLVWVNRYAYEDNGKELISMLISNGAKEQLIGTSARYVILDLSNYKQQLIKSIGYTQFEVESNAIFEIVSTEWKKGFYDEEVDPTGHKFRWVKDKSVLVLRNSGKTTLTGCISFDMASPVEGLVTIEMSDFPLVTKVTAIPKLIRIPFTLASGEESTFNFKSEMSRLVAPKDPRMLYFKISDFDLLIDNRLAKSGNSCIVFK